MTYEPRDETQKFKDMMEMYQEDQQRGSIMLGGISACETMQLFEKNIFYEYDLSNCKSNNDAR